MRRLKKENCFGKGGIVVKIVGDNGEHGVFAIKSAMELNTEGANLKKSAQVDALVQDRRPSNVTLCPGMELVLTMDAQKKMNL